MLANLKRFSAVTVTSNLTNLIIDSPRSSNPMSYNCRLFKALIVGTIQGNKKVLSCQILNIMTGNRKYNLKPQRIKSLLIILHLIFPHQWQ